MTGYTAPVSKRRRNGVFFRHYGVVDVWGVFFDVPSHLRGINKKLEVLTYPKRSHVRVLCSAPFRVIFAGVTRRHLGVQTKQGAIYAI